MTDDLVKQFIEQLRLGGAGVQVRGDACQALADRIEAFTGQLAEDADARALVDDRLVHLADRIEAMTAERDRLRGAIEYVLDGYGLNGPDYRFQCGEEEADWITDHLIAALKGESHDR